MINYYLLNISYKKNIYFFCFNCKIRPCRTIEKPQKIDIANYLDGNKINYGRLLTDEVLAVDRLLVEAAKKNMDIAGNYIYIFIIFIILLSFFKFKNNFLKFLQGTTALIALLEDNKLIVANVGDSRGVMCDGKGNAIPLSFDHKPQQVHNFIYINRIYY